MEFEKNNQVTGIYILYILSIILNLIPIFSLASLGILLFLITFVANYILKYTAQKDMADYSHYAYMTKTIWIFSLLVLIGCGLAYFFGDHSIITNMIASAHAGVLLTSDQIMALSASYLKANALLFAGYFLPITFYLVYRMIKGAYESYTGDDIENPKSWL